MEKTFINETTILRPSREQRTEARDKTHEQRKPKKKRKKDDENIHSGHDTNEKPLFRKQMQENDPLSCKSEDIHYLSGATSFMESNEMKSFCMAYNPLSRTANQTICYPMTGISYSNPDIPVHDESFPTQVSEVERSNADEIVFSNGRSMKVSRSANTNTLRHFPAPENENNTRYLDHQRHFHTENEQRSQNGEQKVFKRPSRPPRYPEYMEYARRLKTFARWLKQQPGPISLCEAGFFYTNEEDLVRCFHCGIGLKDFSQGDNPLNEHVKHSNDCPYLLEYLGSDGLAHIRSKVQSSENQQFREEALSTNIEKYRHPEYQSYGTRLSSFSQWPRSLMQRPDQLAEAGLYYTGYEDNVRCFACDGGLKKWDPDDDPWIEHCRWFPECSYVKQQKGEEYIRLVQATTARGIKERLENEGAITSTNSISDVSCELERLVLKDPELNTVIEEHRETCIEMGYAEKDFYIAVKKLATKGNVRPNIEDILDAMETAELAGNEENVPKDETAIEENIRLKSMLYCSKCDVNAVNALFLPCTHHRMCMTCAQQLTQCPVCHRHIREKIKTYLV